MPGPGFIQSRTDFWRANGLTDMVPFHELISVPAVLTWQELALVCSAARFL